MTVIKSWLQKLLDKLALNDSKKRQRIYVFILADILVINLSAFLALWVRFEFHFQRMVSSGFLASVFQSCIPNTLILLLLFAICQLYTSVWSHAGMHELLMIFVASAAAFVLQLIWRAFFHFSFPRSFPFIFVFFLFFFTVVTRFAYRIIRRTRLLATHQKGARTMLIGAGAAGAAALREFQFSTNSLNQVVCIIDDNPSKTGKRLMGVKIVGTRDEIVNAVKKYDIQEILFAIPSMSHQDKK